MAVKRIIDFVEDNSPDLGDYVAIDNSTPNSTRRTRIQDMLTVSAGGMFATAAQGALADTAVQPGDLGVYATEADFEAANIPSAVEYVDIAGFYAPGDRGRHRKIRIETPSPVMLYHKQSADGAWWQVIPQDSVVRPEMLGGFPHVVGETETIDWYDAQSTEPTLSHFNLVDRTIRGLKWAKVWSKLTWYQQLGQHTLQASLQNLKDTSQSAVQSGTLTHTPGVGIKGNGVNGYLTLPNANTLMTTDDATMAASCIPGTPIGTSIISNASGSAGGISLNPSSSGTYQARMMNATAMTVTHSSRHGVCVVTRDAGGRWMAYRDRVRKALHLQTSIPVPAAAIYLFRSGSAYSDDTIQFVAFTNEALDPLQGAALDFYSRRFFERIGGAYKSGPLCSEIGFTERTSAADMLAIVNDISDLAQKTCKKIEFGLGYYVASESAPIDDSVQVVGISNWDSIFRSVSTDINAALWRPRDFNGGVRSWKVHNMALDLNSENRFPTGSGTDRPGGSIISTNGACGVEVSHCELYDAVLHGVDACNTGQLSGSDRNYANTETPTLYEVGVSSRNTYVHHCNFEAWGDDGVTVHHSFNTRIHDCNGYFRSYRHESGHDSGNFIEYDDGSHTGQVRDINLIGVMGGVAVKNHGGCASPYDVEVFNVDGEYCSNLIQFRDWNQSASNEATGLINNNHATNVTLRNPYKFGQDSEGFGVYVPGNIGSSVKGITILARGDEALDDMIAPAAVNTTTNQITVRLNDDAHAKWVTGQRVRLTTTGGLPAPLVVGADYYIVRVNSTTIMLATSEANAEIEPTPTTIDLTTQGTGHHTITAPGVDNGLRVSSGSKNCLFEINRIEGVPGNPDFQDTPVYVSSSTENILVRNGEIKGAGLYGIVNDAVGGHTENITVSGTSVAGSIGVSRPSNPGSVKNTMANIKVGTGFTTEYFPNFSGSGSIISGSAVVDFPSIAAGATGTSTSVTVSGAVVGDVVVGASLSIATALTFSGRVSATDTVLIYPTNPTLAAVDAGSGTLTVKVQKL